MLPHPTCNPQIAERPQLQLGPDKSDWPWHKAVAPGQSCLHVLKCPRPFSLFYPLHSHSLPFPHRPRGSGANPSSKQYWSHRLCPRFRICTTAYQGKSFSSRTWGVWVKWLTPSNPIFIEEQGSALWRLNHRPVFSPNLLEIWSEKLYLSLRQSMGPEGKAGAATPSQRATQTITGHLIQADPRASQLRKCVNSAFLHRCHYPKYLERCLNKRRDFACHLDSGLGKEGAP